MSTTPSDRGTARITALLEAARARARRSLRPVLVSLAEPAPMQDPLEALEALAHAAATDGALAAHAAGGRMYWARPSERFALAGFGAVVTLTAAGPDRFSEVDRAWVNLRTNAFVDDPSDGARGVGPVLTGGFDFAADASGGAGWWDGFPAALLTVPRLQLAVVDGECWVTTTLCVGPDGRPDVAPGALARLRALALEARAGVRRRSVAPRNAALTFTDVRPPAEWRALVKSAISAIRAGAMEKVVLARAVHATAGRELDAVAVLRHLRAAHPECYVFGYWRGDRAFVGASPERLVRLEGDEVRTGSLAGSIRRGASPAEDAALAAHLAASAKDRAEHESVRRALLAALAELCDDVRAPDEPSVLTLRNVHHLYTPMQARLRAGRTLLEFVGRLHPTPAVGGAPSEAALRFIREHEGLDRGWYAGPVGWLGERDGEFAVALRSALIDGREARLFAGCGVVEDSTPDAEYDESLLKLRPMQIALAAAVMADGDAADPVVPPERLQAAAAGDGGG